MRGRFGGFKVEAFTEGKPVPVVRKGQFTSMSGAEVTFDDAFLDAIVANFQTGAAGQDVPIDIDHELGEAAGWITKLWRDGDDVLALINWNEKGRQLIGGDLYRYVSPTIDMNGKVLLSVSLVNFPAIRPQEPIQLSQGEGESQTIYYELKQPGKGANGMGEVNVEELRAQIREEEAAAFKAQQEEIVQLRARIREEERASLLAEQVRVAELRAFVSTLQSEGLALAADEEKIVAFLSALPAEQIETGKEILRARVVDLRELGSGAHGRREQQELPRAIVVSLRSWLQAGNELEEFFQINPELGEMTQYDLSEFKKAE